MTYTKQDFTNTLLSYLEFEILENHHALMGKEKQAKYCSNKVLEIFKVLVSMFEGCENKALSAINDFSEKNFNKIEQEVLKL